MHCLKFPKFKVEIIKLFIKNHNTSDNIISMEDNNNNNNMWTYIAHVSTN